MTKSRFNCKVETCNKYFYSEEKMQGHMLVIHEIFVPACSTRLAEKQHLEAQDLREEYQNLKKIISSRVSYLKKKFKDHKFNKPCSTKYSEPPLNRWLQNIVRGEGWLQRKDINFYESTLYDELEPYLIRVYRVAIRKSQIINECKEKGYLLE